MNNTMTSMGARELRKNLLSPLFKNGEIQKRLDIVEYFY
jgi:DNA mismatch repair ATPase MutS